MKMNARAWRWAVAGLAFGLSPLYFVRVSWLPLFKLQLALTEFGHWLVLPAVGLAFWPSRKGSSLAARIACLLAALLLAGPALRAWHWSAQDPARGPFSWARLFLPERGDPSVEREDAFFDPAHGLNLTIYRQLTSATGPAKRPYVLTIHGGGWDSGHRDDFPAWSLAIAALGYVVLDADYRLTPAAGWPSQRDDILAAMRYAQSNAQELGLDPDRCVLFGRSAGAHLALATAYLAKDPRIKGVISFYGPADLFFAYQYGKPDDILRSLDLLKNLCGGDPDHARAKYEEASPYLHVNAGTPPTLLAHGDIDALVWNQQSIRLAAVLKAAGRPYQFLELPWATHAFDYNLHGPSGQLAWNAVKDFLKTNLFQPLPPAPLR